MSCTKIRRPFGACSGPRWADACLQLVWLVMKCVIWADPEELPCPQPQDGTGDDFSLQGLDDEMSRPRSFQQNVRYSAERSLEVGPWGMGGARAP